MPIRDARTPTPAELDQLAAITPADVDDAARALAQRVPAARPAIDATLDESAAGPVSDEVS